MGYIKQEGQDLLPRVPFSSSGSCVQNLPSLGHTEMTQGLEAGQWISVPAYTSFSVAPGRSLSLCGAQFLHLRYGDNGISQLQGWS